TVICMTRYTCAAERMDCAWPDPVEERLTRHTLVRVGIVDRHPSFVAEEHVDAAPFDVGVCEQLVALVRGRAPRHRERGRRLLDEQLRERPANVVDDADLALQAHGVLHVSP